MSTTIFTDRHSRVDWLQLVALAGLMAIGVAFVFSATTSHEGASTAAWYDQLWVRQIIWCFAGVSAAAVLCLVDYHILARWSYVAYWGAILLLLLVFIIGTWGGRH